MYNSYTSKRYAPFGALLVSVWVRSYRPLVVVHQVADTVYQRADACRHWLFLFSVIKNTMENRKCQLQTWKVEKYSGNLCAARTGRTVCGESAGVSRRRRGTPYPRRRGSAAARRRGVPGSPGGDKRGQGHRMVPLPPLDSPKPSFAPRLPSVARRNGGTGARFRASFSLRDAVSP